MAVVTPRVIGPADRGTVSMALKYERSVFSVRIGEVVLIAFVVLGCGGTGSLVP